jgi:glycolate oxidase FAD binding subunit
MTTTLDATTLTRALRDRIPTVDIREPTSAHTIDGLIPTLVVTPTTQAEVATVLATANQLGAAVTPRGGTQTSLGAPPEQYDIALDLTNLNALVEHEPADLTCTVEAGSRLTDLQRALGAHGQWLPLDPALPDDATIGGILATNTSGPARIRYGSPRDLVIGMTVALPNGDLVKSGGRVVKNVAGYDMAKLHIGALGTLGIITQASFKIAPLPVEEAFIAIDGALDQLATLATDIIEARLPLLGLVLAKEPSNDTWTLTARTAGGEAAVERSEHEITQLAKAASLTAATINTSDWRALNGTPSPQAGRGPGEGVSARLTVPPTFLPSIATALAESGATVTTLPGIGTLHAAWPQPPNPGALQALRTLCEAAHGALVLESVPSDLKRDLGAWGATRSDFPLMQRLKQQFDPNRILNPGRYLGGI